MDLSDQEEVKRIVSECRKGNKKFQSLLYKELYSKMMSVCYRYSRRSEDAKDIFQEGFIKVFEKIGNYNFNGSLEGWIRRIMVNHAIDHYRRNKNKYAFSETLQEAENISDDIIDLEEVSFKNISAKELLVFVQELSPVYQRIFNMFVLDGYSHAEIAKELNISEGTSKSNLSKAKRNLKLKIREKLG